MAIGAARIRSMRSADEPHLSIGQVLQRFADDFPDLMPSKVRFLEEQGLISPARAPGSNYRKFSDADVARIRAILEMQRDEYLPLKVIAQRLNGQAALSQPREAAPASMLSDAEVLDAGELCQRAGARRDLLERAHTAGLITRGTRYSGADLDLLTALVALERSGIEPRHLRQLRQNAQHEASLIDQALNASTRRDDTTARHQREDQARHLSDAFDAAHRALRSRALRG